MPMTLNLTIKILLSIKLKSFEFQAYPPISPPVGKFGIPSMDNGAMGGSPMFPNSPVRRVSPSPNAEVISWIKINKDNSTHSTENKLTGNKLKSQGAVGGIPVNTVPHRGQLPNGRTPQPTPSPLVIYYLKCENTLFSGKE